jgi:3-oxoacyl-[acyl-carrier-protein] synthase-1
MNRAVHIVAVAARTPVGLSAEGSAAAVRAGITRMREHDFMVDAAGEPLRCASDGVLEPGLLGYRRVSALARAALIEAVRKLGRGTSNDTFSVLLALPEARPGFGVNEARRVQRDLMAEPESGPRFQVERVGEGHAGAIHALERGIARIANAQDELVIVAGADSYLDADTLDWLEADRRILRAETRSGLLPGEGAAAIVLASTSIQRQLRLPTLGYVRAAACAQEKRDPMQGAGTLGEALTEVVVRVAGDKLDERAYVADVYCDINGERSRGTDWGFALLRTGAWFRDGTQYVMPVGACGDLGAASAVFNVVLAVRAWQRGYAHGPRAVVWGASWKGLRGAALIEQGEA